MLMIAENYMEVNLGLTRKSVSTSNLYALSITDPNAVESMLAEEAQVLDDLQEKLVSVSSTLSKDSEALVSLQLQLGKLQNSIDSQFGVFNDRLIHAEQNMLTQTTEAKEIRKTVIEVKKQSLLNSGLQ